MNAHRISLVLTLVLSAGLLLEPRAASEQALSSSAHVEKAEASAAKIHALLADNKIDEAVMVFQIYEASMERFLAKPAFDSLKTVLETVEASRQKDRGQALALSKKIEQLLDNGRTAEAFSELKTQRAFLNAALEIEEMRDLDKKVGAEYVLFLKQQAQANRTMREIRDDLAGKRVEKASMDFEMARANLERCLRPETFSQLEKEVQTTYGALKDKKRAAAMKNGEIAALAKRGAAREAEARFLENSILLQKYLDAEQYRTTVNLVETAKRDFNTRRARAGTTADRIGLLLEGRRVKAAWTEFNDHKNTLRNDLADPERFSTLKERVETAWYDLREKESRGVRTERKIEQLISAGRGRQALALFKKERPLLAAHGTPGMFQKLESRATISNAQYEAGELEARNRMAEIKELLDSGRVERAFERYKRSEQSLDFYFSGDPGAESLDKRVSAAWAELQEQRQGAMATVRQVKSLSRDRRGNEAWSLFSQNRPALAANLDGATLSSVESTALQARRDWENARALAQQNAANINALLDRKLIEDACIAFDSLGSTLSWYLNKPAFETLKERVHESSALLKEKKGEALRIIGIVNLLCNRERGDSAYALFSAKRDFCTRYLSADVCKKTALRVEKARNDYSRNRGAAARMSTNLMLMDRYDQVLPGWEQFSSRRDFLKQYAEPGVFVRLDTVMNARYRTYMERRKAARTMAGTIRTLVKNGRTVMAYNHLKTIDDEFVRYLPANEYQDLSTWVTASYKKTVNGRKEAARTSGAIRELLARGAVSEAYTQFRESRAILDEYLKEKEFSRLQDEVVQAYAEAKRKGNG